MKERVWFGVKISSSELDYLSLPILLLFLLLLSPFAVALEYGLCFVYNRTGSLLYGAWPPAPSH